jgi:cellulose synthase (UDP-forming)
MGIAMLYLLARISLFLVADYLWYEKIPTVFLLFAEAFIITHGVGYFLEIFHVSAKRSAPAVLPVPPAAPVDTPPVAIIVSSFKEPLEVIEATLISFSNRPIPTSTSTFWTTPAMTCPGRIPRGWPSTVGRSTPSAGGSA